MFKILVLIHRYLGIAIGLMLIIWCLSGIIMLYVQYPVSDENQRVFSLAELSLDNCCVLPNDESDDQTVDYFRIEMQGGVPIVRMGWYPDDEFGIYLNNGQWFAEIGRDEAIKISSAAMHELGHEGEPDYLGAINYDQWTLAGDYSYHTPLHYFSLNDDAGTQWYVSSYSGEILLTTTANQRFWNWPGAVTHWLYFPIIRNKGNTWTNTIIWLSMLGTFLTIMGLYLGIRQYRFKKTSKPRTPYKSWWMWHHYTGLVFGLFALTFVFSGLMSMTPFGLFQSTGYPQGIETIRGEPMSWAQIATIMGQIPGKNIPEGTRVIEVNTLFGKPALITYDRNNQGTRYDINTMQAAPIDSNTWDKIDNNLGAEVLEAGRLDEGDTYYYSHHVNRRFPVYRVILNDEEKTRYYFDYTTGELLSRIDNAGKQYRWWFLALHRGDFHSLLRTRPVWDLVMLVLLVGVTIVCGTGFYTGVKRYLPKR
jgi:hypothetical protein